MKIFAFLILMFAGLTVVGQTTYDDVAVLVNDNSQTSIEIGNYFQSARNIPNQNMIHVFAPKTEEIDTTAFRQLRVQIKDHLDAMGIADSINYIVTTKGVPLKINSGCVDDSDPGANCASVDSELTLLCGSLSSSIGGSGFISNPYFNSTTDFERDSFGIYLVTRLDGYSKDDVINLIERSGPNTGVNKTSAKAIIDVSNAVDQDSTYFRSLLTPAYNYLVTNSWNAEQDYYLTPPSEKSDVFGYFGLGHGPLSNVTFNYDWSKGAVGSMSMCNSAYTFDAGANIESDFLIADMIKEGCTGAIGHVDDVFLSQLWDAEVFVNHYFDTAQSFNLAESYYSAEKNLSWQSVVIGDPKASIEIDNLASIDEFDPDPESINVYPNPSTGVINVKGGAAIESVAVVDMRGAVVQHYKEPASQLITLDLKGVQAGIYLLNIQIDGELTRKSVVVNK